MNRVVHFEIHAKDTEKVKRFYQDVFGWEMQQMGSEFGNYVVVKTGPGPEAFGQPLTPQNAGINGGITTRMTDLPQSGAPVNAYVCVIGVENTDEMVKKIVAAGGTIALDAMEVPGVGRLAYGKDPEGTIFGVLQPDMTAPGAHHD